MNAFKKIPLDRLLTLLMLATLVSMASSAAAMGASNFPQERIFIAPVQFLEGAEVANDTINLTVANVGSISATIIGCIVKNEIGNVVTPIELAPSQPIIEKGTFKLMTLALNPDTLVDGTQYTLTLVTAAGGSFVSSSFGTSSNADYDPLKDMELQSMLQATPAPSTQYLSSFLNPVTIGSTIAAGVSVIGAYKLSQRIAGSKNRKDRLVVFFFTTVIFISIIIWLVSAIWFPMLATL